MLQFRRENSTGGLYELWLITALDFGVKSDTSSSYPERFGASFRSCNVFLMF